MYLEVKVLFSIFAMVLIGIAMALLFPYSLPGVILLFIAIGMILLSDIVIGYKITSNHLTPLLDPIKADKELGVIFTMDGLIDFVVTRKAPMGKREFNYYNTQARDIREASVINDGRYPIHTINGNSGFVAHEYCDQNVNLYEADALDKLKGDDVKEIYQNLNKKGD